MPTNVNTNYLNFSSLVSRAGEDARVLTTGPIDFTIDTTYNIDLTATVRSANLQHPIQACFIDCSQVAFGPTAFIVNGTGQRIVVPAGVQGYYPLLIASRNFVFTVENQSNLRQSRGSGSAYLFFVNVPMVAAEWSTSNISSSSGGSAMNGPVRTVSTLTDTASVSDYTILCDCSAAGGNISESLPPNLSGFQTSILNIVKVDSTNRTVVINGNGAGIAGSPNGSAITLGLPYQSVTLQWTGGSWEAIASHPGRWFTNAGTASLDLRDTLGVGAWPSGVWWRMFADPQLAGGYVFGFYDVLNNRYPAGFDSNGNFALNFGLSIANPQSITLGSGWLNWTPSVSAWASMTVTGVSISDAQYLRVGPICWFKFDITATLGGIASNQFFVSLPLAPVGSVAINPATVNLNGSGLQITWSYCDPSGSICKVLMNGEGNFPLGSFRVLVNGHFRCA